MRRVLLIAFAGLMLCVPAFASPRPREQKAIAAPRQTAAEREPADRLLARLRRLLKIVTFSDDMLPPRP